MRETILAIATLFSLILMSADFAHADVWTVKGRWNEAVQSRFSEWVQTNAHPEMALREDPRHPYYHQILDCADLVYYLYAIYSFENELDFVATDTQGRAIGPKTKAFDYIQNPNQRFKKFLEVLIDRTNTETLQKDSVLLNVDRTQIKPGSFLLTDRSKNHVWMVQTIRPSGTPVLLTGTSPGSHFLYPALTFPTAESAFANQTRARRLSANRGGFRRLRWQQEVVSTRATPSQLDLVFENYFAAIATALRTIQSNWSREAEFDALIDDTCMQMRIRTNLVTDATIAIDRAGGRPLSTSQLDTLSTTARDGRIRDLISRARAFGEQYHAAFSPQALEKYARYFKFDGAAKLTLHEAESHCLVQWAENRIEPLAVLVRRFEETGRVSDRADAPLESRWGER